MIVVFMNIGCSSVRPLAEFCSIFLNWKLELVSIASKWRDTREKCRWTGPRWSRSASICALESSLSPAFVAVEKSWKSLAISGRSWPATLKPSASERGREGVYIGLQCSNLSLIVLATLHCKAKGGALPPACSSKYTSRMPWALLGLYHGPWL